MNIKLFVSVRDRLKCTRSCIESLIRTCQNKADIIIFDNASTKGLHPLMDSYKKWLTNEQVAQVVLNRERIMPEVYWSKNYSWQQALLLLQLLPPEEREFLVMIDNDVVAENGWVEACLDIWNSPKREKNGVRVISPYDDPPRYDTRGRLSSQKAGEVVNFGGHKCYIRFDLVSRFWFTTYDYWLSLIAPDFRKIIRNGKPDREPTDFHYFSQMKKRNEHFAVMAKPLVHDPKFPWPSARMSNNIGADANSTCLKKVSSPGKPVLYPKRNQKRQRKY